MNNSKYNRSRISSAQAENNCWDTASVNRISGLIFDFYDNPSLGIVYFEPYISGYACGPGVGILDLIRGKNK